MTRFVMPGEKTDPTTTPPSNSSLPSLSASTSSDCPLSSFIYAKSLCDHDGAKAKAASPILGADSTSTDSKEEIEHSAAGSSSGPVLGLSLSIDHPLPTKCAQVPPSKPQQAPHKPQKSSSKVSPPSHNSALSPLLKVSACARLTDFDDVVVRYRALRSILVSAVVVISLAMICLTVISVSELESRQAETQARYRLKTHDAFQTAKLSSDTKRELDTRAERIRELELANARLESDVQRLWADHQTALATVRHDLTLPIASLKSEIRLQQTKSEHLESNLKKSEEEKKALVHQVQQLQQENVRLSSIPPPAMPKCPDHGPQEHHHHHHKNHKHHKFGFGDMFMAMAEAATSKDNSGSRSRR